MKRLSLILFVCLLVVGCEDDRIEFPKFYASPVAVSLTPENPRQEISIFSSPKVGIQWTLAYKPTWLQVSSTSGYVNGYPPLVLEAITNDLLPQTLEGRVVINTNLGELVIPVTLTVTKTRAVSIYSPLFQPFQFAYNQDTGEAKISNVSKQSVNWEIVSSAGHVLVTPSSGTLEAGQVLDLTLTINRSGMVTKNYDDKLILKIEGIENSEVPVTIQHFTEEKWMLESPVIDAAYDRTHDNLILLMGNRLLKLKPETKTEAFVDLPGYGSCVSVSQDGNYAVVGHADKISLIDLVSMEIEKTYPLTVGAGEVVLAPNNWAYVFPSDYGWQRIRCIDLATGNESLSTGNEIFSGTKALLHPSGNYIYGTRNGNAPYNAEKYDIRNGTASYLYSSPYPGEYEFYGNTWMADDGSRIFTNRNNAFNLTDNQSTDLYFADRFTAIDAIEAMDMISSKNLIYAVYSDFIPYEGSLSRIKVFSGDELNPLQTKEIPDFLVNADGPLYLVPSQGVYGFFNSTGTKFFVIVKTIQSMRPDQWGVATINVD